MKNSLFLAAAVATVMLQVSCKGSSDPVDLKLNLQAGSRYSYSIDMKTESVMGPMNTSNDMLMQSIYTVAGREGTDMRINVAYNRVAMNMKSAMMTIAYDSDNPGKGDSMLNSLSDMLNKPFTMTVSEKGEISKIEGLDKIINTIGDTTSPDGAMRRQQMMGTFNDTSIKSMMQQALNIFPDHPVAPGDTWKNSYNMNVNMMSMNVENEFRLISVGKGTAHIEVTSKIAGGGGMKGGDVESMQINIKGDLKGSMDVAVATGLISDGKLKQNIKGDLSINGMKLPVTMTQDIHITAKKM